MGSAAAGIANNRIEIFRPYLPNGLPRQLARQPQLAIVSVQRPATRLVPGRDDLAPIPDQHLHRIAVGITEDQILRTANQHRHPVLSNASGG